MPTMNSSISLLSNALSKSLEPCASSTPSKHDKFVTNCGYCYFAKGSWQIRFKPYGVSVSVGVLGGNQAVATTHNPSRWLGRIDPVRAVKGREERERVPPTDLVMIVLKSAELHNVLHLTRKQVENGRKQLQKLLVVKLRDDTKFDMAPVLSEILGGNPLRKHETLAMLDYALAYMKTISFPYNKMEGDDWELSLSGQPMPNAGYEHAEAVKTFITACLNAGFEKSNEDNSEKVTSDRRQVAGAATYETSVETPRSAMDITSPFGVEAKSLQVRFLMDQPLMLKSPPPRRRLETTSPGDVVAINSELSDDEIADTHIESLPESRRITDFEIANVVEVACDRDETDEEVESIFHPVRSESKDSMSISACVTETDHGDIEPYPKTSGKGADYGIQKADVEPVTRITSIHDAKEESVRVRVSPLKTCAKNCLSHNNGKGTRVITELDTASDANVICDGGEPGERIKSKGYEGPSENTAETGVCAVEVNPEMSEKLADEGIQKCDVIPFCALSGIAGIKDTEKERDILVALETCAIAGCETMIATRITKENESCSQNQGIDVEQNTNSISDFRRSLSNVPSEPGFVLTGDMGLYVENALTSPPILTGYAAEPGVIETEFNDSLGDSQVATASDAAEVLALTSNGSFDMQDDDIRHVHALEGGCNLDQAELHLHLEPSKQVRALSVDEPAAETILKADSAAHCIHNSDLEAIDASFVHRNSNPNSQAPSDAQRATFDGVNVSPDYDFPSFGGAAFPQEYCHETKQAEPVPGASQRVENVFAAAATAQIHTASCQGVKPTASETAHEEHGFHAPNSRPMTRLRRASLKADHVAVAPSKKRKFDHVVVAIPTRRSA